MRAAEAKAGALAVPAPPIDVELERLRADCIRFFGQVPEPPVYSRKDDPVREEARKLIPAAEDLLARCIVLAKARAGAPGLEALRLAVLGYLEMLCHVEGGKLGPAEEAWVVASQREREAVSVRRLFVRTDEQTRKVYDRATESSRYDPAPESTVRVKLVCPNTACHHTDDFSFSPRHSTHQFTCPSCRLNFIAFFGEVMGGQIQVDERTGVRRYLFRLREMSGGLSRIEFEDASGGEFTVARQDLLAFIYSAERELKGVLDLSSSRILWIKRLGACFVATVAYGEGAPELAEFRAFRDDVLRRTEAGAWLVRQYYARGPALAAWIQARPRILRLVRGLLQRVYEALVWRRGRR
jgi:hypothetical protein